MRAILAILVRDLRSLVADRSAIVIALVAPFALMSVFALTADGPTVERRPIGLVAGDAALTASLREGALAALGREGIVEVRNLPDRAAAEAAVRDESVDAAIVVGASGVTVLTGKDALIGGALAEGSARNAALVVSGVQRAMVAQALVGGRPGDPVQVARELVAQPAAVTVAQADAAAGGISQRTQMAAGMATFFLFFTVQFGVLALLAERRAGTLARLLVAPVTPRQVLAAKLLVSFVLGVVSMTALIVASRLLLGTDWGNPIGVALLVLCGVSAATATVALVGGLARTVEQAAIAQSMVAMVLGLVGGAFFSMARAGGVAAVLTRLTPHHWFNEGLVRMTGGGGWRDAIPPAMAMLLFAVVVGIPGLIAARRMVRV